MDYLVYAYLQLGQDAKAKAVLDEMTTVTGFTETFLLGPVCAGRFAGALRGRTRRLEGRGRASGTSEPARRKCRRSRYFARALGAARSGNPEAAKADIAKLARAARQAA